MYVCIVSLCLVNLQCFITLSIDICNLHLVRILILALVKLKFDARCAKTGSVSVEESVLFLPNHNLMNLACTIDGVVGVFCNTRWRYVMFWDKDCSWSLREDKNRYSEVHRKTGKIGGSYLSVPILSDKLNIWNKSCSIEAFIFEFFWLPWKLNYLF